MTIHLRKRLSSFYGKHARSILFGFASVGAVGLIMANRLLPEKVARTVPPHHTTPIVIEMPPIVGAWCTKASFLEGWTGLDWGVWCFNTDSTVMMGSSLDTHGYGAWSQNPDGSYAFSAIEQFFDKQVWTMNINIYAPQVVMNNDGNSFSTPDDQPVQGVLYDPAGNFIGRSTIELLGTRIQLGAANILPKQGSV